MDQMNRTEISRALAKALSYKSCGRQADADYWARRLVTLLECSGILADTRELPQTDCGTREVAR